VLVGAAWGAMNWDVALKFLNRVSAGVSDPILGRDAGFYLFALPFYDFVYWLLLGLAFISLLAAAVFLFMPRREEELRAGWWERGWDRSYADYRPSYAALGAMGLVIAWGYYLNIFYLMYSRLGAVAGPGWTDVHVRWPAYWIMVAVAAAAGSWLLMLAVARRLHDWAAQKSKRFPPVRLAGIPVAALAAFWFLALQLVPGAVQWLVVEPNEITVERPYIEHNIEFTRRAFQLDKVEERQFPASAEFTRQTAEQNQHVLSQVRLWDPRALVQVYKQFQEIRLYYEFADVDIDRYTIAGEYRQVMVSPREMNLENLPSQSQTFVNRHFKYTHGYGLTLAPVNEFTSNGLPALLVKDLPPATEQRDLKVARPQIYYGKLTDDYVVADSKEEEFDYPSGQENVYTHYEGRAASSLTACGGGSSTVGSWAERGCSSPATLRTRAGSCFGARCASGSGLWHRSCTSTETLTSCSLTGSCTGSLTPIPPRLTTLTASRSPGGCQTPDNAWRNRRRQRRPIICTGRIAGPAASVLIAAASFGLWQLSGRVDWPFPVGAVFWYLGFINTVLVVFNMVPAFPLDGGRILRSLLWQTMGSLRKATQVCSFIGSAFGLLLIALGVFQFIAGNYIGGMWWFLLGMFLRSAAAMSYQQVLIRRVLEGEPIRRFVQPGVRTVSLSTARCSRDWPSRS